jgi:hypothetical protein
VGEAMGISEDAAKQRVTRAVEKLRTWFAGRGVVVPSAVVIGWLGTAVKPAPPGLIGLISETKRLAPTRSPWRHMSSKIATIAATVIVGTAGVLAVVALGDATHHDAPSISQNTAEPATQPATAPIAATTQPAEAVSVTVRALIDGRSRLSLQGNTARWQNLEFAAPGKHGGRDEPTTINGVPWHPLWEDSDLNPEGREKSMSDAFDRLTPPLPKAIMDVTLTKIRCRENATIVQQPAPDNDFTTIVEFDDTHSGGPAWYEVKLTFTPQKP